MDNDLLSFTEINPSLNSLLLGDVRCDTVVVYSSNTPVISRSGEVIITNCYTPLYL